MLKKGMFTYEEIAEYADLNVKEVEQIALDM